MKIEIGKGSDWKWKEIREINSLDDLLGIIKEFGHDIVVGSKFGIGREDYDYRVTVYDDYLE